jgi:hypothetical protein
MLLLITFSPISKTLDSRLSRMTMGMLPVTTRDGRKTGGCKRFVAIIT